MSSPPEAKVGEYLLFKNANPHIDQRWYARIILLLVQLFINFLFCFNTQVSESPVHVRPSGADQDADRV
jgi:hypothetical protein